MFFYLSSFNIFSKLLQTQDIIFHVYFFLHPKNESIHLSEMKNEKKFSVKSLCLASIPMTLENCVSYLYLSIKSKGEKIRIPSSN